MNFYRTLQKIVSVRNPRARLAMLLCAHLLRRRTIGVYIDPVVACNLRCRMCAFSDPSQRGRLRGRMTDGEIAGVADGLYARAIKVQIGCGAEPTLDRRLPELIRQARDRGVPYVSITTNGQLLDRRLLEECVAAGLDEVTLSMHGTTERTYEWLMTGASFAKFKETLGIIASVRAEYPRLKLRINYTVNADNVDELPGLIPMLVDNTPADVIQIRPVQKLGSTAYDNFDLTRVKESYEKTILTVAERCRERGITCLVPGLHELDQVATPVDERDRAFEAVTYCYVGPGTCYGGDFVPGKDTYAGYHRRKHTVGKLLRLMFSRNTASAEKRTTKKLNYRVK